MQEVRAGKILVEFLFFARWTEPQARSINLQKKNETNIFTVRTEQASSIKFLVSWLYFEFPDGTAHLIGNARATIRRQKSVFITPFLQNLCRNFWSDKKEKVST